MFSPHDGVLDKPLNCAVRPTSSLSNQKMGDEKERRTIVAGDDAAVVIAGWRTDGITYDRHAIDKERAAKRAELRVWLQGQFDKIQAGGKPDMKEAPPLKFSKWEIDAP